MEFEYTKYRTKDGIFYRPTLDVFFEYKGKRMKYEEAIVDTGSDYVQLPLDLAEVLGAEPDFDDFSIVECACGDTYKSYASRYPLEIIIDHKGFRPLSWKLHVRFVDAKVVPLLGHRGFLSRFEATFDGKNHKMRLPERK